MSKKARKPLTGPGDAKRPGAAAPPRSASSRCCRSRSRSASSSAAAAPATATNEALLQALRSSRKRRRRRRRRPPPTDGNRERSDKAKKARRRRKTSRRKAPTKKAARWSTKTKNGTVHEVTGFKPTKEKEEADTKLVEENPEQAGENYIKAQQNLPDVVVVGGEGGRARNRRGAEP